MRWYIVELTIGSMAAGLGMTPEEWKELKGNVDDSFWVMRIIGLWISPSSVLVVKRWISNGRFRVSSTAKRPRRILMWGAQVRVYVSSYRHPSSSDHTLHFQGLRLFDVRVILILGLRSKGSLGSSGPMIRRGPYKCSSSSPDCSSRRPVHTEVPPMKPSNRVLGSTLTR